MKEREMKKTVYKKIKDLYLDYQAILAGNGIGDLDLIVDQIKAECKKANLEMIVVLTDIDNELYGV
tara:strand:+ start:878 stop:1075 length:198 start_codon:yes stop_codon:yes gene_type:complete